ncbi:ABC transporter ATP-binding protein [Devriesea agamarum]|uniref:ABC transporter ATP-binding protein n=1 Tax=Devriesea agamarum TaxID=472569 RepID=UPI00071C551F|nr:ABC transporter ATP-binding protein [Devriesea agamarum]
MPVLSVDNLHHRYGKSPDVLCGITVDFEPATMTAVMGPSGSGKSTFLNCVAGLLRPTQGRILYRNSDLATLSAAKLDKLRRIAWGFIFQSYNLIDALTAIQNVKLPALFDGKRMSDESAKQALRRVGLAGLEKRYPDQLSGGQRQRVAIARALASQRDIVFADEPTGALDSESRREVMNNLGTLPESGSTVILVTHDPTVAAQASRVLFLYDGAVAADESGLSSRDISERLADLEARSCSK